MKNSEKQPILLNSHSVDELLRNECFSPSLVREINEFCKELLGSGVISAFEMARVFDDGSGVILYSDPQISDYVVRTKLHVTAYLPASLIKPQFWYLMPPDGPYQEALFDIKNLSGNIGVAYYIERFDGYYDMFAFWSQQEQHCANNFFINNKEYLERFSIGFRNAFKRHFTHLEKYPLRFPVEMLPNIKGLSARERMHTASDIELTLRQRQCLSLLLHGSTSRGIAEQLKISHRTVDDHLLQLKFKFNCFSKSELIATAIEQGFLKGSEHH
jgi:DNA-binding CsgD family transcriptional regulator